MNVRQKKLHKDIVRTIIKFVNNDESNDSDHSLQDDIKNYFMSASEGIKAGFCFCPNKEGIINILNIELELND